MDRDTEIAQIEHELDILRSRYALYRRWGRILRVFFMIWLPLAVALLLIGIAKLFITDALMGSFFVGFAIIVFALLWLAMPRHISRQPVRRSRWIDLASPPIRPLAMLVPWTSNFYFQQRSDAEVIEEQIATRERRLKELKAAS